MRCFPRALVVGLLLYTGRPMLAQTVAPRGAQEPGITGYVLAPDGTPVSGGTVGSQPIDRTGRFRLLPPRSGLVPFVVTVSGFAPYRFVVNVPASRTLRLPVIRLSPAVHFRVRLVSATGEWFTSPQLRRRSFDENGNPIADGQGDQVSPPVDNDGAIVIGPLLKGVTTLAVDSPLFAQTRLPDVSLGESDKDLDGGTVVLQQPGGVLRVDVLDADGSPVPDHEVYLEDALPRSPLVFRPVRTNQQGRATFDRLAAGRYRVRSGALERCRDQVFLSATRDVALSGSGTAQIRLVIGGRANFLVTTPFGPASGISASAAPNMPASPLPPGRRAGTSGCRGIADQGGRLTLTNFPPGPAHIDVQMANSIYTQQVDVPSDGQPRTIVIPGGFQPVNVFDISTKKPVTGASITWTGGGARVEATTTVTGVAVLEGVGTSGGSLAASARGYQSAQEQLAEPPGFLYDIALTPAPVTAVRARVLTTSGEPMPGAVVELVSSGVPQIAVTDAKGAVAFPDAPPGSLRLIASAEGFVTTALQAGDDRAAEIVMKLIVGYRVIASVELPAGQGSQAVRVVTDAGASMENVLDGLSDRAIEPPGRLSLGPLAPGLYVIELHGATGTTRERVSIVNRSADVTIR